MQTKEHLGWKALLNRLILSLFLKQSRGGSTLDVNRRFIQIHFINLLLLIYIQEEKEDVEKQTAPSRTAPSVEVKPEPLRPPQALFRPIDYPALHIFVSLCASVLSDNLIVTFNLCEGSFEIKSGILFLVSFTSQAAVLRGVLNDTELSFFF